MIFRTRFSSSIDQEIHLWKNDSFEPRLVPVGYRAEGYEERKHRRGQHSLERTAFETEKLDASTMILADSIEKVPAKQIGIGQFVLGDVKVRPALNQEFTTEQKMGIYYQVYNLKVDPTTAKSNVWLITRSRMRRAIRLSLIRLKLPMNSNSSEIS